MKEQVARPALSIPTSRIAPDPDQPRKDFDPAYINGLGDSIAAEGLLQPITVRRDQSQQENYLIIAGECRWRAHRLKGIQAVPCFVADDMEDGAKRFRMQFIENKQRKDMNLREEVNGMQRMASLGDDDTVISRVTGYSVYRVGNLRRMAGLSEETWGHILSGNIVAAIAEYTVGVVPMPQVDGLLARTVGKSRKLAAAIVGNFVQEMKQDVFALAMEQAGIASRKPTLIRNAIAQLMEAAAAVESLTVDHQRSLARSIGAEVAAAVKTNAKNRRGAAFLTRLFSHVDAVMTEN